MMVTESPIYLELEGLPDAISLCSELSPDETVPAVFQNWPYRLEKHSERPVFASITRDGNSFVLASPFWEKSKTFKDETDVLCALVVETAWAKLRAQPDLLCLHGAAIEFAGRLVVIPNTRRAGKSTLTTVLAARGYRVFTDDFLPIRVAENGKVSGLSCGIAPRLRLPIPDDIAQTTRDKIGEATGLSNNRYAYFNPDEAGLATHDQGAPFGSVVLLERTEDITPTLAPASRGEALKALIVQNFSRSINAAGIVTILEFLARNVPSYKLQVQNAEQAADLLEAHFSSWDNSVPLFNTPDREALFAEAESIGASQPPPLGIKVGRFKQADDTSLTKLDDCVFLTGPGGKTIHYLNDGAQAIWNLMSEATSLNEAIEIMSIAFPDIPLDQIRSDTEKTFKKFAKSGLLQRCDVDWLGENASAEASVSVGAG